MGVRAVPKNSAVSTSPGTGELPEKVLVDVDVLTGVVAVTEVVEIGVVELVLQPGRTKRSKAANVVNIM